MKHLIALFTVAFLIGCSSSTSPVDDGLENQIFHFGNGSEPQGIDPHIVTGVPASLSSSLARSGSNGITVSG